MTQGSPASNLRKQPEVRSNTLRLDQRTLTALMEKLDAVRSVRPGTRRRYSRFPYRMPEVNVVLTHPGGSVSSLVLCARDISAGGLSLLHNSYVHKGSICNVLLDRPGGTRAAIPGRVVRCGQLAGLIHEVGVSFNTRVSLRDFLCPDPLDEFYSLERVEPGELRGKLLHIDDTGMGRRLLKALLNDTSLIIDQVSSLSQALEATKHSFDVILTEYQLDGGTAADLIMALRVKQITAPVIVLLGEASSEATDRLRAANPAGVLRKPITPDRLQRCIAEVLLLTRPTDAAPTGVVDESRSAMVRVFLEELRCQSRELEAALRSELTDKCLKICRELRGSAPTLGFASIAKAAEHAEQAITANGGAKKAAAAIGELVTTCRRAAS